MKAILVTVTLTYLLAVVNSLSLTDLDQDVKDKLVEGAMEFANETLDQYLSVTLQCNNSLTVALGGCNTCSGGLLKRQLLGGGQNLLGKVIKVLMGPVTVIQRLVNNVVNAIPNLVNKVVAALEAVLEAVLELVEGILALLLRIVQGLIGSGLQMLQELAETVLEAVEDVGNKLSNILNAVVVQVSSVVMNLLTSLQGLGNNVLNIVGGLLDLVDGLLGGLLGGLGGLGRRKLVSSSIHVLPATKKGFFAIKSKRSVDCLLCSTWSTMDLGDIINDVCKLETTGYLDAVTALIGKVADIVDYIGNGNTVVKAVSGTTVTYNLGTAADVSVDVMADLNTMSIQAAGDVVASHILAAEGLA